MNYIATRDGVELLDENADSIYMHYIATRPRAEKHGEHGLFGAEDAVDLEKTLGELKAHEGNVWTIIYSLRREDAARLGYDNAESWRALLRSKQADFAEAMQIPPSQLRWYAAFHDEGAHPHIHMMLWSDDPKYGFLRKNNLRHLQSVLTNTIYADELKEVYIQKDIAYENMGDLSLSNKTIRGLHTMLRQCLEQAVTERLIPYNPANGCRLPKKEKKKMQIIPPEKIRDYLKAAEEWGVLPMFYLELSTGLRRGELVALLWSDLNLQTKTLTVSKSVSRGKGELVVTEPKTENSVREIYLSDEAIRLLVEDRKNHPFSPYMFPSPKTGGMYGPDCVGRIHKKLLEKAGIEEHVRFHDLRHTFSTLAIQSGIDPKTVAEILGHASAEFSLGVYTHVTAGMKKEAAQKISGFMAGVG